MIDTLAGTDTEAPADDLRGQIETAFSEAETTDSVPEAAPAAERSIPEAQSAAQNDASGGNKGDHPTDPARFADGKFKPTKTEAAPEVAAPVKDMPSKDTAKASTEQPSTAAAAPPVGWTAAEKAEWSKLSPVAQAAVSRREAEMSRGGQQWSEEKRRYEGIIAPVAQAAQRRGISADEGIRRLMSAQDRLDQDPAGAIRWLAQSYGVNLATLAGQAPAEGSRETVSQPDVRSLVLRELAPILGPIQERMQAEETQRQQSTQTLVDQFASAPGHELWQSVESDLMDLIPGIKARNPSWSHEKVLQDAYDRAVYANPETRASLLAQKDATAEAKRIEEAKTRTAQARRAGVSVTGSPAGSPGPQAKDSLRAEIEAAFSGG